MKKALQPCPVCGKASDGTCCRQEQSRHHHLYNNARWRKARKHFLAANPLCEDCLANGKTTLSEDVHHTVRHGGNLEVFWDMSLWQGLCHRHHTQRTNRGE